MAEYHFQEGAEPMCTTKAFVLIRDAIQDAAVVMHPAQISAAMTYVREVLAAHDAWCMRGAQQALRREGSVEAAPQRRLTARDFMSAHPRDPMRYRHGVPTATAEQPPSAHPGSETSGGAQRRYVHADGETPVQYAEARAVEAEISALLTPTGNRALDTAGAALLENLTYTQATELYYKGPKAGAQEPLVFEEAAFPNVEVPAYGSGVPEDTRTADQYARALDRAYAKMTLAALNQAVSLLNTIPPHIPFSEDGYKLRHSVAEAAHEMGKYFAEKGLLG